jgi:hypothetical protein
MAAKELLETQGITGAAGKHCVGSLPIGEL